jgi:hypothetical protein
MPVAERRTSFYKVCFGAQGEVMTKLPDKFPFAFGVLVAALLMTGCAATRSVIDVTVPRAEVPAVQSYVRITQVNDRRRFELNPRNPSVPSLENAAEINDPGIRARAIARKRGGFGNAMADILLPENRTVDQLVREAVTNALHQSGYQVVDDKSTVFQRERALQGEPSTRILQAVRS